LPKRGEGIRSDPFSSPKKKEKSAANQRGKFANFLGSGKGGEKEKGKIFLHRP